MFIFIIIVGTSEKGGDSMNYSTSKVILKGLFSLKYSFKKKETHDRFFNVSIDKLQELDRLPPVKLNLKMYLMIVAIGRVQSKKNRICGNNEHNSI